ncbi:DUF4192 family protein [Tessaracoccus sp. HDW20]|uniref:DUF4192 family protein n=1 Tax=Tessaracoccus coleopterorum TaxID=2714950 RepID=UPI0018D4C13A|nr:DUF4192 family protein [Tessaracoccus coleopterorum]NHB83825.1 DUF4192 family protein [Tessaracoccus coleopterorum]
MKTPLIRGTTRADLLALPAIMLGFHPTDSCVALALDGRTVRFCIRIDTPAVATELDRIVAMIRRAAFNAGAREFVLVGYGKRRTPGVRWPHWSPASVRPPSSRPWSPTATGSGASSGPMTRSVTASTRAPSPHRPSTRGSTSAPTGRPL